MGEIADDMIDGTSCSLCGCYFEKQDSLFIHGYPVVCWDCWDDLTKDEREMYQKAETKTL
jgi:hypothetical protein